jgi:hypothetical protein
MSGVGHAAYMGHVRNEYKFLSEDLEGRSHVGNIVVNGRIILK